MPFPVYFGSAQVQKPSPSLKGRLDELKPSEPKPSKLKPETCQPLTSGPTTGNLNLYDKYVVAMQRTYKRVVAC